MRIDAPREAAEAEGKPWPPVHETPEIEHEHQAEEAEPDLQSAFEAELDMEQPPVVEPEAESELA